MSELSVINADKITQSKHSINDYVQYPKIASGESRKGQPQQKDANVSLPAEPTRKNSSALELHAEYSNSIIEDDDSKTLTILNVNNEKTEDNGSRFNHNSNEDMDVQGEEVELKEEDERNTDDPNVVPSQFKIY